MKNFVSRYTSREYEPIRNVNSFQSWIEVPINEDDDFLKSLNGMFLQVGSNPQFDPPKNYHWFDGDGMIHAIKFSKGKVFYKCAFVETLKYKKEKKENKNVYPGLTNPVNKKGFFLSLFRLLGYTILGKNPFPDTSNTDIVFHNGKLLSLWFLCGNAYEISIKTLETIGPYKFSTHKGVEQLKYKFSAHPKICPNTGELFFMDFALSWKKFSKNKIYVGKVSKDGNTLKGRKISVGGARVLHDLVITENYVIIADLPIKPSFKGISEDKGKHTKFAVISRDMNDQSKVLWFTDTSAYNILHFINAYEEHENIIIDGLKQDKISILPSKNKSSKSNAQDHSAYLNRWILNIKTGEITNQNNQLQLPFASEFPTINKQKTGKKQTYSYLTKIANTPTFNYDGIIKYNHIYNTYEIYKYPKNHFCSEVQFISKPNTSEEDNGYLLSWVHILWKEPTSRLHIFDAKNIQKGPIRELIIPNKIPIGFHTEWVENLDH